MSIAEAPEQVETLVEPEGLYEVIDGKIVEVHLGVQEVYAATLIGIELGIFLRAHPIGRVFVEALFRTRDDRNQKRKPDVAFLTASRWPLDRPLPEGVAFDLAPDLAIEVVSPTDFAVDLAEKVVEYFRADVRQVWLVYRTIATIHVYESIDQIRVYRRGDVIDGGDLIPGFRLAVSDVLPEPAPRDVSPD